jgi:serine/threonine protein kinase/dipeptidyl aminopeptidase/acylaminoacyl peptidase
VPDRQSEIERICQAALELDASSRASFLAEACAGDQALQLEVESLLAYEGTAVSFLGTPALEIAARRIGAATYALAVGQPIGTYLILSRLGAGGMGEVYRARDQRLGRDVAIKVLPAMFAADPKRLARFEREARMLAAMNHPNIAAIYGVEEPDGVPALVLELVEGQTLAERLAIGPLAPHDALNIAQQIATALEAAHEKGIVHSDLKPANVKITPDGVAKVLDFGLATVDRRDGSGPDLSQSSVDATAEGVLLGTAAYMSPEQARGRPLDTRADIWAFGCVLYEMLTGRSPFAGETIVDTIAAILRADPEWRALPDAVPVTVRRLLQRCLAKDPTRRLRDIGDARLELEDAVIGPFAPGAQIDTHIHRDRLGWSVAGILAVTLMTVVLGWIVGPVWRSSLPPSFSRVARLTSGSAQAFGPAISADGKWVAYLSNASGSPDVWAKFIAGDEAVNLTASAGLDIAASTGISGLEISPDGAHVAVIARPLGSAKPFDTWEVPAPLPGAPRKLLDGGVGLRWSPDGRQITFIHAGSAAGDALMIANADGTSQREIIKTHDAMHIHWPAWSRDGYIYFIRTFATSFQAESGEIFRIDPRGGNMEPVVQTSRRAMFPLSMPDGTGLIYASKPATDDLSLWWKPNGGGKARQLTMGAGEYAEPRISADGQTIVCTLYETRQSLIRVPITSGPSTSITFLSSEDSGDLDPTVAPSGRLVFASSRAGNRHLWTTNPDGTNARPLTSGPSFDDRPSFSPDGHQIAFVSDRGGQRAIWLISPDGGTPRMLANVAPTGVLGWSRDGSQVVYAAGAGDWPGLWTISVADGRVKRLPTPGAAAEPSWSPVRDVIAYIWPTVGPAFTRVGFVDATGRPVYSSLPAGPNFVNGVVAWAPDGRRVAAVKQDTNTSTASVWLVDPEASDPFRELVDFPPGARILGIAWTHDGSALIVGKQQRSSAVVILDRTQ